jgi:hypothetical protein
MHCVAFLFCKLQSLTTHLLFKKKIIELLKNYGKRYN